MVVIGENVVTPSSIVYLLVKLWISPPDATLAVGKKELSVEAQAPCTSNCQLEGGQAVFSSREDAELEDLDASSTNGYAHAPHWSGVSSKDDTFYETCFLFPFIKFHKLANLHGGSR